MAKFQTAGIIVKFNDASVSNTLHDVVELLHTLSIEVLLDHSTRSLVEDAPTVAMRELGERCDVVIVIGGDGTLLHAARAVSYTHLTLPTIYSV